MIESPFGRMPENVPRWDLTGTEGCGGGKVVSWLLLMFLGYKSIYRSGDQRGWGRAYPPGHALLPRGFLVASPTSSSGLLVFFRSKKDHREGFIPFGIPFLQNSKIGKKRKLALGPRLIG